MVSPYIIFKRQARVAALQNQKLETLRSLTELRARAESVDHTEATLTTEIRRRDEARKKPTQIYYVYVRGGVGLIGNRANGANPAKFEERDVFSTLTHPCVQFRCAVML